VADEPLLYRDELLGTLFTIADISADVARIVRLLEEDDDGEEEAPEDAA
jgi:hypothetical protein